jgi:hypothetical protein
MFAHEFALLIAAASPFATLCAMHAGLWAAGERDTLVLPVMRDYPRVEIVDTMEMEFVIAAPTIPQNDMDFRLAA